MLDGLSWKRTEIILLYFEIVPKYCISDSLVDFGGTVSLLGDSCPHSSRYNGHLN